MSEKFTVGIGILVAVAVVIGIIGVYAITQYLSIPTTGQVATYDLTANPISFDWGTVDLGVPVNRTVEITNAGSAEISGLTVAAVNVVGLTDFVLIWNLEGQSIASGGTKTANFQLTVNAYSTVDFSFDITVSGNP